MVFIWNYKREPGRNRSLGRITSHSDTLRTFAKAGLTNRASRASSWRALRDPKLD
jgi:hypothetical protein